MNGRLSLFLSLLFLLVSENLSSARTLEEIKRSGTIVFAVNEQPAVYQKTGQEISGFDYSLALLFARQLGVKPRFVVVNQKDFYNLDIYKNPVLLNEVDVCVGHISLTAELKNRVTMVPSFQCIKVCVHDRKTPISGIVDLPRLRTSALSGDNMNVYRSVESITGRRLNIRTVDSADEQAKDLQLGTADYLIMDSDRAFYYTGKFAGWSVNADVLKEILEIYDVGWTIAKDSAALKTRLTEMFRTVKTNGVFEKLWQQTYGMSYGEYREGLKIIEKKGDMLFRKSLDYAFNKQYEESVGLFQSVKKMKLASERMQKLYDSIYIDWLKSEAGQPAKKQVEIIDNYMKADPSEYFIKYLKDNKPQLFRSYLVSLKSRRDEYLLKREIPKAFEIQSIISLLNPNVNAERKTYDDIYIILLEEKEKNGDKDVSAALDDYIKGKPSAYFFQNLKKKIPALFNDYLQKLRRERDNALTLKDVDGAYKLQETIVLMEPESFDEKNKLEQLKMKSDTSNLSRQGVDQTNEAALAEDNPQTNDFALILDKAALTSGETEPALSNVLKQGDQGIEFYEGERYFQLGLINLNNKNYEDALISFRNAKSLNYRTEECEVNIRKIKAINDERIKTETDKKISDFNDYFSKAISFYLKEDYSQALVNILVCLSIFPDNQEAVKYAEIISDNLRAEGEKTVDESSPYYLFYLNRIHTAGRRLAQNDLDGAKKIYEEILTIFPNNELAKQKLIECLYKLNPANLEKVLNDYFKEAVKLLQQKKTAEANSRFSFIRKVNPKYPDIDSYIEKSKIAKPGLPKGAVPKEFSYQQIADRAIGAFEKGDLQQSLSYYRQILRYYPDDYKALVNSSRIENLIQTRDKAAKDSAPAESVIRVKAENYYLKGQFYYRIKDYKKSLEMWEEAYRIDPSYRKVYIDIKRVKLLLSYVE